LLETNAMPRTVIQEEPDSQGGMQRGRRAQAQEEGYDRSFTAGFFKTKEDPQPLDNDVLAGYDLGEANADQAAENTYQRVAQTVINQHGMGAADTD